MIYLYETFFLYWIIITLYCCNHVQHNNIGNELNNELIRVDIEPFSFSLNSSKTDVLKIIKGFQCSHIIDNKENINQGYFTLEVNRCLIKDSVERTYEFVFFFKNDSLKGLFTRVLGADFDDCNGNNGEFSSYVENTILKSVFYDLSKRKSSFILNLTKSLSCEAYTIKIFSHQLNQELRNGNQYPQSANLDTIFFDIDSSGWNSGQN